MGVWAGGAWGARAPPKFYGRAKITAKFGQNIKISEKLFVSLIAKMTKIFLLCRKKFCRKSVDMSGKNFLGMSGKKFLVTFGKKNINVKP